MPNQQKSDKTITEKLVDEDLRRLKDNEEDIKSQKIEMEWEEDFKEIIIPVGQFLATNDYFDYVKRMKDFIRQTLVQSRQQFAGEIKQWIHKKSLREQGLRVPDIDEYLAKLTKE